MIVYFLNKSISRHNYSRYKYSTISSITVALHLSIWQRFRVLILYNGIPHPAQDTKQESNTNIKDGSKYNTSQEESQEVSSFQAESH